MLTVTRRGLIVLGGTGAAGVALAGCSEATEPREEASPEELTAAEAEAETNLSGAYVVAAQVTSGEKRAALETFAEAAKKRVTELGGPDSEPHPPDGGPDELEALSACANLANAAIAAHLEAAGLLERGRGPGAGELLACGVRGGARRRQRLRRRPRVAERVRDRRGPEAARVARRARLRPRRHLDDLVDGNRDDRRVSAAAHSRREAIRRAALAAGAVAAGELLRAAPAVAQATDDEDLRDFLVEAIGLEQVTVLAYSTAAADAGADLKPTFEQFRDQEQAHANALRSAIDELGFDPPEPPDSATDTGVFDDVEGLDDDAAERLTDRLGRDRRRERARPAARRPALKLENDQLSYYCAQGPGLDSEDLATTAASIGGCQAQHLVVLYVQTGRDAGPTATAVGAAAAQAGGDAAQE